MKLADITDEQILEAADHALHHPQGWAKGQKAFTSRELRASLRVCGLVPQVGGPTASQIGQRLRRMADAGKLDRVHPGSLRADHYGCRGQTVYVLTSD